MPSEIILHTPAKINLGLWVEEKRPDGYHNIKTIFIPISLFDRIRLKKRERGIVCKVDTHEVPQGADNICYKATELFFKRANLKAGVEIFIEKRIPQGRGFGGGSSDAAATIEGLMKLFDKRFTHEELKDMASQIGMDVFFFFFKKPCIAERRGNELSPISIKPLTFLLFSPDFPISTKWAYNNLTKLTKAGNSIKILEKSLKNGDYAMVKNHIFNSFEEIVFNKYPELKDVKERMEKEAYFTGLSGSGSGIYGAIKESKIQDVWKNLKFDKGRLFLVHSL